MTTTRTHCPKNAGRCPKKSNSDRPIVQTLLFNRDVECPSVGTIFLLIALASGQPWRFAHNCRERRPPNPIDQHVGSRVRMCRLMLAMSQEKLAAALGLNPIDEGRRGHSRRASYPLSFWSEPSGSSLVLRYSGA